MKDSKIEFDRIKPFVMEMFIFILVIILIFGGLLAGNFIEISIRIHLLTVTVFVILCVLLLSLFSRIVNMGIRALVDFFMQSALEEEYEFLRMEAFKASVFTEKISKEKKRDLGIYYLIHAKKGSEIYTFISPDYIDITEGKVYRIRTGKASKILLEVY